MSKVNLTSSNSWYSASCCCITSRISIISCSLASSIFRNFSRSPVMAPSSSRMRSSAALAWEGQVARSAQPLPGSAWRGPARRDGEVRPGMGRRGSEAGGRAAPWPGRSAPAPGGRAARAPPAGCAAPPGPAPGAHRTPAAGHCPPPPGAGGRSCRRRVSRTSCVATKPAVLQHCGSEVATESPGGRQGPRGAAHSPAVPTPQAQSPSA
uniref:Uncharacterized protein n=1 Tax=Spermophilus dauricus TaxID=99837 RepID=A0A8C9PBM3_SPEDA